MFVFRSTTYSAVSRSRSLFCGMITYKCASFLHVTRISDMRCSVITCLLLLLPQLSYQSDGGPFCLDCVGNLDAQCSIHYDNETITCIANTTVCNHSRQCEEGEFCHFAFTLFPGGAWAFDAECFPDTREDECILEAADRTSFSFPPHQGTTCQCNNCTLDEPLVYVHPRHHVGVSITPSSVSPSPSPSSGESPLPFEYYMGNMCTSGNVYVGIFVWMPSQNNF